MNIARYAFLPVLAFLTVPAFAEDVATPPVAQAPTTYQNLLTPLFKGNETIVAKPTPAPRTATAPAKTTARNSGAKKTATKAAPAAAETADSETK